MSNVRNDISLLCILLFVYAKIAPAWNSFSLISLPCAIHVLCHTFRLSTLLLKFGKYMLPFKKSLIASIIVGLFLTGCGGSSSGNNSQTAMDNSASDASTSEQVKPNQPVKPSKPSGDSNNSVNSNDDNNSDEQNNTVATGVLRVKVIDGYMKGILVCVVDETEPSLPCDERFSPSEDTTEYTTGDKGDIEINLDKDRIDILKEKGFVKFKATVPKGDTDNILGTDTETDRDFMLVGTKYFDEDTFNSQIDDDAPAFVVSPFTTIADIVLRNKESSAEIYKATVDTITKSLGIDNNVMTDITATDYGTPELCGDDGKKAQCKKALIAGETLVRTGYIPQPEDTEKLDLTVDTATIAERLETRVKPMVNYIAGMDETESIAEYLATQKYRFEALSTGIADDWRCAVNRLSEVMCWGNNAWNNLGDPIFTEGKKSGGTYDNANEIPGDELARLHGNYSATPLNVKIINKQPTDENDYYVNLTGVSKVMTGNGHACAITHYGEVYCWGNNSSAQLGWGETEYTTENKSAGYARKVVTGAQNSGSGFLSNVVDLSLGVDHSCALTNAGDIYCWGDNTAKELGGNFTDSSSRLLEEDNIIDVNNVSIRDIVKIVPNPVRVPAPDGIKFNYISKNGYWAHCALSTPETSEKDDDERIKNLWCWGNDASALISHLDLINIVTTSTTISFLGFRSQYNLTPYIELLPIALPNRSYHDHCKYLKDCADFWYWYAPQEYYPRYSRWPMLGRSIRNITEVKNGRHNNVDIRNLTYVDIIRNSISFQMDNILLTVSSDEPEKLRISKTDRTIAEPSSELRNYGSRITRLWINPHYDIEYVSLFNENTGKEQFIQLGNLYLNIDLSQNKVFDMSLIQRSVCALVLDENTNDNSNKLICKGSNAFGQLPGVDQITDSYDKSFAAVSLMWKFSQNPYSGYTSVDENTYYDDPHMRSGATDYPAQ